MPDMYNRETYHQRDMEAYNAQINPECQLRESWYYDMVESFNATAVSGGEWSYCWGV